MKSHEEMMALLNAVVEIAVKEYGVPCHVEFPPEHISGGHDDRWFVAGFANGKLDIDVYADENLTEDLQWVGSQFTEDDDPRHMAIFLYGMWNTMSI